MEKQFIKTASSKRRTVAFVLVFFVFAAATAFGVFALVNHYIVRDFPVIISAENVIFLYNDRSYLDEIGSSELELYKGAPTDFTMSVRVVGSHRVVVNYEIDFEIASDSEIVNAIEVYVFRNGRYEFLCMLSELENVPKEQKISGLMVTNYDYEIDMRLVYSSTAGKKYDDMVNSEAGAFIIRAKAVAEITADSDDYVFAWANDFADIFRSPDSVGKTIVLTEDVVVSSSLTSAGLVGIELNGRTLTLNNGAALTIDCKNNNSLERRGITNAHGGGGLAGNGTVSVINTARCYLLDIALRQS